MTDSKTPDKPVVIGGVTLPMTLGLHELRLVDEKGRTQSVLLDIKALGVDRLAVPGMDSVTITATVRRVNASRGTDYRLDKQRKSIQELLDHLKHHCPALKVAGAQCDYPHPMIATETEARHEAQQDS